MCTTQKSTAISSGRTTKKSLIRTISRTDTYKVLSQEFQYSMNGGTTSHTDVYCFYESKVG